VARRRHGLITVASAILPDARAEHGYWYQTLIADAAATGVMLVGLERGNTRTIGVGLTMFALGGPIIHALHGHGRRALLSLSARVAAPLALGLAGGYAFAATTEENSGEAGVLGFAAGCALAVSGAIVLDAVWLTHGTRASPRVIPAVGATSDGTMTLGLSGAL